MDKANISIKFVAPCILGGANQEGAEFRVPSIRGALRWWHRALQLDWEDEIFGVAENGKSLKSSIIIRELSSPSASEIKLQNCKEITGSDYDYFLWPLRQNKRGVIQSGARASVAMSTRHCGYQMDERALKAFLLLGSLGTRSRRCYGSIWPEKVVIDDVSWRIPNTDAGYIQELQHILDKKSECLILKLVSSPIKDVKTAINACSEFLKAFRCGSRKSGAPSEWGQNDHDVIKGKKLVYRPALGLPLTQRYSDGKILESSFDDYDRMASPIHFKVIPLGAVYLPVAIIFPNRSLCEEDHVTIKQVAGKQRIPFADAEVNLDLLMTIANPDSDAHKKVWRYGSSKMVDYWNI